MWPAIAHNVGGFLKYVAAAIILIFSVSLSYSFFSVLAPPDMPWFTWAALGLTDIGMLIWLAVFRLQRYHDGHKTIAFVMVLVCLAAVLYTDAMELARLFHLVTLVSGLYYYALIVLLLIHFGAFALDEFMKETEKFQREHGNFSPSRNGNLIAIEEGEKLPRPLAPGRPKGVTQEVEAMRLAAGASGGENSPTKRGRLSTGGGKPGGHAPGSGKTSMSGSTSGADIQRVSAPDDMAPDDF
jgi:hypothetical protein